MEPLDRQLLPFECSVVVTLLRERGISLPDDV
jgi:hypothetical protein